MHVIRRRGWEMPERLATPEELFLDRRSFLAATGAAFPRLRRGRRRRSGSATCRIPPPTFIRCRATRGSRSIGRSRTRK
jgi:hypothetical protein